MLKSALSPLESRAAYGERPGPDTESGPIVVKLSVRLCVQFTSSGEIKGGRPTDLSLNQLVNRCQS